MDDMIHLNIPTAQTDTFRILPKYCRKFISQKFVDMDHALYEGQRDYPQGFRVFRQRTYEWYEPLNIEVAKIAPKKEWEVKK